MTKKQFKWVEKQSHQSFLEPKNLKSLLVKKINSPNRKRAMMISNCKFLWSWRRKEAKNKLYLPWVSWKCSLNTPKNWCISNPNFPVKDMDIGWCAPCTSCANTKSPWRRRKWVEGRCDDHRNVVIFWWKHRLLFCIFYIKWFRQ